MSDPFLICALPRSRTAWLSRFLTHSGWACHHERSVTMRSMRDVVDFFAQPGVGSAETAAAQGWWLIKAYVPRIRFAVVRRPVDDVVAAMMRLDIAPLRYDEAVVRRAMIRGDRDLDRLAEQPGVLSLDYDDLDTEEGCAAIYEHCLQRRFDRDWWLYWRDINVQADVRGMLMDYLRDKDAVEQFKRDCRADLRRLAREGALTRMAA